MHSPRLSIAAYDRFVEFAVRDGVRLAYEVGGDPSAGGPPIVLVHGMRCDHTNMQSLFGHLRSSHRVVSLDLRGHGSQPVVKETEMGAVIAAASRGVDPADNQRFLSDRRFGPDDDASVTTSILASMATTPEHASRAMGQTVDRFLEVLGSGRN